jgi:hypothetical protein
MAQHPVAPPKPAVAPLIGERYANDADGDRIDDELADRMASAHASRLRKSGLGCSRYTDICGQVLMNVARALIEQK